MLVETVKCHGVTFSLVARYCGLSFVMLSVALLVHVTHFRFQIFENIGQRYE